MSPKRMDMGAFSKKELIVSGKLNKEEMENAVYYHEKFKTVMGHFDRLGKDPMV